MKVKNWKSDDVIKLGEEIKQSGMLVISNRMEMDPSCNVNLDGKEVNAYKLMLMAVYSGPKTSVTEARKITEDLIAITLKISKPTSKWAEYTLEASDKMKCSQGWTEKQIRKMIEACEGGSLDIAKDWSKLALNKDQVSAMEKIVAYYETQKGKLDRKLSSKQYQDSLGEVHDGVFGKFNWMKGV